MDVVDALVAAIGVEPRDGAGHDWAAVEASLGGLRLPADYKRIVDTFPRAAFRGPVRVIRPGFPEGSRDEYLGYYEHVLDDLRAQRKIGYGRYPYPIFPEAGGLLPWADTSSGLLIFWLTEGDDPDAWPVVWTDDRYEDWQLRRQSMSEHLLERAGDEIPPEPELLEPAHADPEDESEALLAALGTEPVEEPTLEWFVRAAQWGFMFPADYRTFHDTLGPGMFCDVGVFGPDAPDGWNLAELLRAGRTAVESAGHDHLRFHPDAGGMIPWGMTPDGWLLGWLPRHPDPDRWCVTALGPGFLRVDWPELSFSEFLLHHAGVHEGYDVSLPGRAAGGTGPPVFRGLAGQ